VVVRPQLDLARIVALELAGFRVITKPVDRRRPFREGRGGRGAQAAVMRPEVVVGAGAALLLGALAGVEWWAEHRWPADVDAVVRPG
jgi:hypothetical protein